MALDEIVRIVVAKVNDGSVSFNDILKVIAPKPTVPEVPRQAPTVAVITHNQRVALDRLAEVFGQCVPTEVRKLQPVEVTALVEEKECLDAIKRLVEDRHEGMRTTVFNHLDLECEEQGIHTTARTDKRGHYVVKGQCVGAPGTGKKFTREVREGACHLSVDTLKGLIDHPGFDFSNDDFLNMTSQVRVIDEHKVMLALKNKPTLINVIKEATERDAPVASLYLRKE